MSFAILPESVVNDLPTIRPCTLKTLVSIASYMGEDKKSGHIETFVGIDTALKRAGVSDRSWYRVKAELETYLVQTINADNKKVLRWKDELPKWQRSSPECQSNTANLAENDLYITKDMLKSTPHQEGEDRIPV
jgi:transketolase